MTRMALLSSWILPMCPPPKQRMENPLARISQRAGGDALPTHSSSVRQNPIRQRQDRCRGYGRFAETPVGFDRFSFLPPYLRGCRGIARMGNRRAGLRRWLRIGSPTFHHQIHSHNLVAFIRSQIWLLTDNLFASANLPRGILTVGASYESNFAFAQARRTLALLCQAPLAARLPHQAAQW